MVALAVLQKDWVRFPFVANVDQLEATVMAQVDVSVPNRSKRPFSLDRDAVGRL